MFTFTDTLHSLGTSGDNLFFPGTKEFDSVKNHTFAEVVEAHKW